MISSTRPALSPRNTDILNEDLFRPGLEPWQGHSRSYKIRVDSSHNHLFEQLLQFGTIVEGILGRARPSFLEPQLAIKVKVMGMLHHLERRVDTKSPLVHVYAVSRTGADDEPLTDNLVFGRMIASGTVHWIVS